jgi:hypothetical protein
MALGELKNISQSEFSGSIFTFTKVKFSGNIFTFTKVKFTTIFLLYSIA